MRRHGLTLRYPMILVGTLLAALALLALASGCDDRLSDSEAAKIADEIIEADFPDMVDAAKTSQSYQSGERDFYEVAYGRTVEYESDGGTVSAPRIVVVTVDRYTGETIVAVSD